MTVKDIYPLISSHEIILFDITANKVHVMCPESIKHFLSNAEIISEFGEYEVASIIPLDFQKVQITIKKPA